MAEQTSRKIGGYVASNKIVKAGNVHMSTRNTASDATLKSFTYTTTQHEASKSKDASYVETKTGRSKAIKCWNFDTENFVDGKVRDFAHIQRVKWEDEED